MPDWSYQTVLRPVLFRLSPEQARTLTLGAVGMLADLPLGGKVIDLMGHMRPPGSAAVSAVGLSFPSPVGLAAGLDIHAAAARALARFGFGFLEFGPISEQPVSAAGAIERDVASLAIRYPDVVGNRGVHILAQRLAQCRDLPIPVGVRLIGPTLQHAAHDSCLRVVEQIVRYVDFFSLEAPLEPGPDWSRDIVFIQKAACGKPLFLVLNPSQQDDAAMCMVQAAVDCGVRGVMVGGGQSRGAPIYEASLAKVRRLHNEYGSDIAIFGSGGIIEPAQALAFLDAGATLIQIHSGLVYSGPGLPKRINEAVVYYRSAQLPEAELSHRRLSLLNRIPSWIWAGALGVGLAISAIIVGIVAMTRIVLPYDEAFVGLTRDQLVAINPHLLSFMAHDRVTVAGTMLSTGILYTGLALGGIRRGQHWALTAYAVSALAGFLSFFLFVGYGYFDPLHGALSLGLLPLFILSLYARRMPAVLASPPNLRNTIEWYWAQWGQALFVMIGFGLTVAGIAIMSVGVTTVFVQADIRFMQTTAETLAAVNDRLVPLVAHDRAGFGGNLVSVGLAVILLSLWGFRQGERWVWWTLVLSGLAGFVGAIGIHIAVGYLDLEHLLPAVLALVMFGAGAILTYPYLHYRAKEPRESGHVATRNR